MKRALFLGSTAATALAGCGGRHVMQALPGVAPASSNRSVSAGTTAAAAIPAAVLANPIIGEVRRYDGATAPNSAWMLTQGQQIKIADNPHLFSILRTVAGGDGKATFNLPKPALRYIIAVSGTFPTSPAMLVATGRHIVNHADSLGDGARAVMPPMKSQPPAVVAELQHRPRSIAAAGPRWTPLSSDMEARIAATTSRARDSALGSLGPANRALVASVTDGVVSGRLSLNDAIARMTDALSGSEAAALLAVNDRTLAEYRPGWSGTSHPNPALEAARFLISIAFTPDQVRTLQARS